MILAAVIKNVSKTGSTDVLGRSAYFFFFKKQSDILLEQ
jgi:hypothetical protein